MGNYIYTIENQDSNKYNLKPDTYDHRDKIHDFYIAEYMLPRRFSLRNDFPPIYNQGHLGSCTANAIAGAIQYDNEKQKLFSKDAKDPSRLFIYYNERVTMGTVDDDSGSSLRNGMNTVCKNGFCSEEEWPYDIAEYTVKPKEECYEEGAKHAGMVYKRVKQTLNDIKHCLAMANLPIVFGCAVYESMESEEVAKTGMIPLPKKDEKLLGGHAMVIVAYDQNKKQFCVRNSWGNTGDNGYYYMSYDYILNPKLTFDLWTIKKIN